MNTAFPRASIVAMKDARPGSVMLMRRGNERFLVLATNEVSSDGLRSFVILDGFANRGRSPLLADRWRSDEPCLCIEESINWDVGWSEKEIDPHGFEAWETPGALVVLADRYLMRTYRDNGGFGAYPFVDVIDGSIYQGQVPNALWTFSSWRLLIGDDSSRLSFELLKFSVAARKAS